jgi:hypothetical protein
VLVAHHPVEGDVSFEDQGTVPEPAHIGTTPATLMAKRLSPQSQKMSPSLCRSRAHLAPDTDCRACRSSSQRLSAALSAATC